MRSDNLQLPHTYNFQLPHDCHGHHGHHGHSGHEIQKI